MSEKPILFSSEMVRALMDGRKTQTRRTVKWKPHPGYTGNLQSPDLSLDYSRTGWVTGGWFLYSKGDDFWNQRTIATLCPYGQKGDTFWVRETFCSLASEGTGEMTGVCFRDGGQKYDDGTYFPPLTHYTEGAFDGIKWKPSIHMPRWASRITLEITDVWIERLQSISEADAKAEGVHLNSSTHWATEARDAFAALWDTIHGKGAWKTNPWVWRIQFKPM